MVDNVSLTQLIEHIGEDEITILFGGDNTHTGSSTTKTFNVGKAALNSVNVTNLPSTSSAGNTVSFQVFMIDAYGFNAFEYDTFDITLYIDGVAYEENNDVVIFSNDLAYGYAPITFTIPSTAAVGDVISLTMNIASSKRYLAKSNISIGSITIANDTITADLTDLTQFQAKSGATIQNTTIDGVYCLYNTNNYYENYWKQVLPYGEDWDLEVDLYCTGSYSSHRVGLWKQLGANANTYKVCQYIGSRWENTSLSGSSCPRIPTNEWTTLIFHNRNGNITVDYAGHTGLTLATISQDIYFAWCSGSGTRVYCGGLTLIKV